MKWDLVIQLDHYITWHSACDKKYIVTVAWGQHLPRLLMETNCRKAWRGYLCLEHKTLINIHAQQEQQNEIVNWSKLNLCKLKGGWKYLQNTLGKSVDTNWCLLWWLVGNSEVPHSCLDHWWSYQQGPPICDKQSVFIMFHSQGFTPKGEWLYFNPWSV